MSGLTFNGLEKRKVLSFDFFTIFYLYEWSQGTIFSQWFDNSLGSCQPKCVKVMLVKLNY